MPSVIRMNIPNLNYKRQLSNNVIVQKQVNIAPIPVQTRFIPSANTIPAPQQMSRSTPSTPSYSSSARSYSTSTPSYSGLLNSPMVGRIYRAKPGCGSCGK